MPPNKVLIPLCSPVPALVLYKSIIAPKVHGHRRTADRASGNQRSWNFHILLLRYHPADRIFIVIGFVVAGSGALPQAVIALSVKKTLLIKAGELELMIHIGGEHKVILTLYQFQKPRIWPARRDIITIDIDVP